MKTPILSDRHCQRFLLTDQSCDLRPIMKCLLVFCVQVSSLYKTSLFFWSLTCFSVKDTWMLKIMLCKTRDSFKVWSSIRKWGGQHGFEVVGFLRRTKTFSIALVKIKILFLMISRYFLILNLRKLKKNYFFAMIICDDTTFLQWTPSLIQV